MIEWDHKSDSIVDQVIGAFFLVRKELFDKLDGFDERFFVYFEEVDFSLRAYNAGWKSAFLSKSKVYHKGGGTSEKIKARRLFYSLRSRILYGYKHFNLLSATSLMLLTLFVEPWARLVWNIIRGLNEELVETFKAYFLLWKDIPKLLKRLN
jgi:GT2 family glycosyltransferase